MRTPLPLNSKREKYSLALCSIAFIVFSGMVHTMIGSVGSNLIPTFTVEATPSPQTIILIPRPRRTATPTPTPHPTQTPPPSRVQPRVPAVHPPKPRTSSHDTSGPTEPPTIPPATPSVVSSTAPVVAPSSEPVASPTPITPIEIKDGTFTYKAPLEYPQMALQQNIEGTVVVLVTIGPTGELLAASIATSSGNAALDEAALEAARASRYSPYVANGSPVTQQYKIVYEFRLNQ